MIQKDLYHAPIPLPKNIKQQRKKGILSSSPGSSQVRRQPSQISVCCVNIIYAPDLGSVKCLGPGLCCSGVDTCVFKGAGVPSQTRPRLKPQWTTSRDSAVMEEACAQVTSAHSGHVATESGIRQSEDIILNHMCNPVSSPTKKKIKIKSPPTDIFTCNCCVFSRKINHHGALLHALILCLCFQDFLSHFFPGDGNILQIASSSH